MYRRLLLDVKKRDERPSLGREAALKIDDPSNIDTSAATSNDSDKPYPGFFIKDEISGLAFLVDTGAFKSIFPAKEHEKHDEEASSCLELVAANGTAIHTYGERELPLRFNGRSYSWTFILANVRQPLLGADFLSQNHLMVEVTNKRLLDIESFVYPCHYLCDTPRSTT